MGRWFIMIPYTECGVEIDVVPGESPWTTAAKYLRENRKQPIPVTFTGSSLLPSIEKMEQIGKIDTEAK